MVLYGDMDTLVVQEYPSIIKYLIVGLAILNIFFYYRYDMSYQMEDNFEKTTFTWISMGFTICAILNAFAYETSLYYEVTFAGFSMILTPYYLYNQIHEAKPQNMTKKLWFLSLGLGLLDALLIIFINRTNALIIILAQLLISILYEHHQVNPKNK